MTFAIVKSFIIVLILGKVQNLNNIFLKSTADVQLHEFFENYLSKFSEYQIIFHTDFATISLVNNVINKLNNNLLHRQMFATLVYNHDTLTDTQFVRPNVSRVLSLLFSNNINFWANLASPSKISSRDVITFVSRDDNLKNTIIKDGSEILRLAGKVLLIEKSAENDISIYRTCYYCGELSKKFQLLEVTTSSELKTSVKEFYPNTFRDMNGHVLNVVFVQYFPFIYCKANSTGFAMVNGKQLPICLDIKGIESDFMRTMGSKLNFTFIVHLLDPSQSFFNMIQYVNSRKADIAFGGISVTADRIPLVQFTKQYNSEDYHFLYVLGLTFKEIFDKFLDPFRAYFVWALYVASFILLSFSLFVALKMKKDPKYETVTIKYVFWSLGHFFVEQSHPNIDLVYRARFNTGMLLGLWWWVCLILCNFYKSSILSTMVQPPNAEPDDIEELVRAGFRFAGNIQYADIIKDLLHVPDPLYIEALRKTIYGEDACDVLKKILPGHVAMLDEYSEIQFELKTICKMPDDSVLEKFRIARKAVRSSGHGWATQLGAPYRQALDYYMSLVLSAGLFKKWTQNVTNKLAASLIPKSREIKNNEVSPLSLQRFTPILTIYAVGMSLAIICFAAELVILYVKKYKKNRKLKHIQ